MWPNPFFVLGKLQLDGSGGDSLLEGPIVLHKKQGGPTAYQQRFDLHPGVEVDEVQRFVPDIQVCLLTEAGGQKYLLFLPAGVVSQLLFELDPGKAHLAQNGLEQGFLNVLRLGEGGKGAPEVIGVLGDVRDHQAGGQGDPTGVVQRAAQDCL